MNWSLLSKLKVRGVPILVIGSRSSAARPLFRELSQLAQGNMPLARGLSAAAEDATPGWGGDAMKRVATRLEAGDSLAVALSHVGRLVPDYVIALVEMGERSGRLAEMLRVVRDVLESSVSFKRRIAAVLVYPAALFTVSLGIVSGIMVFIVPKYEAMFMEMNVELPLATRLLCDLSRVTARTWFAFPIAVLLLTVLVSNWNWLRYHLPLLGPMARDASSALLAAVLGPLLRAGLDVSSALDLAKDAITQRALAREVGKLSRRLLGGESLSDAVRRCHAMHPGFRWLIVNGEASGRLPEALDQAKELYGSRCKLHGDYLEGILQPAAILAVAAGVTMVVNGLMFPLIKLMGSMGE